MLPRMLLGVWGALVVSLSAWGQTPALTYYWDDPVYLVRQDARFPQTVENGQTAAAFWQERRNGDGWVQSFVSVAVKTSADSDWTIRHDVLGPFNQVGQPAQLYSAVLSSSGVFWVAVLADNQVLIYRSDDGASSFQLETRIRGTGNLLVPRLVLGPDDVPLLFVTVADATSFRIADARRVDGVWTPLSIVTTEDSQKQSFQPFVTLWNKKLVMVYQTLVTSGQITYQVFRKDSDDGGITWTPALRLSNFPDDLSEDPDKALNQRPTAFVFQDRLFVSWERQTDRTQTVVEVVSYNAQGRRLDDQPLTVDSYIARNPEFYVDKGSLHLAWFDNRNQTYDVWVSTWDPALGWGSAQRLSSGTGNSVFGHPVHFQNDLYFFWQNNFTDNPSIVLLQPDRHVDPPTIRPVNFKVGKPTNRPEFDIEVEYPHDISGIKAFNTLLTADPEAAPDHEHEIFAKDRQYAAKVPQEGLWYLAVSVEDNAGNWSTAVRVPLDLKTTPPGPVAFDRPATDEQGYLTSNSFHLTWKPSTPDTVAYAWTLTRVGDTLTQKLLASLERPSLASTPTTTLGLAEANNVDDGLWTLTVAAFDEAGNRGPLSSEFFRLNKFVPFTQLAYVDTKTDAFGRVQVAIHGRGFVSGGRVNHVYVDKDGKAPYDLDLGPRSFTIESDRLIDGIVVEGLDQGIYRIGVNHPVRGTLFTGPVLKMEPSGNVKIGDYRNVDQTVWTFWDGVRVFFSVHAVEFWAIMVLLALTAMASGRLLVATWVEGLEVSRKTAFWFADTENKWALRARRTVMKTKGLSLTFKFAASILGLMGTVVLMLSLTLGFFITENSQVTLGTALQQRTQVLLDSLATGARFYLRTQSIADLGNLPPQIAAMGGEALSATITGPSVENRTGYSYAYASNDPDLAKKIDTPRLIPGISVWNDPVEPVWTALQATLQAQAETAVGDMARQSDALTLQDTALLNKPNKTDVEKARFTANENQNTNLKAKISTMLVALAGQARALPPFNVQNLLSSPNKRYVFYQPYMDFTPGNPSFVRGLIRIEVSSEKIERQITDSRNQLILVTVIVALIALVLGLVGAFVLSALTINPIRKLVAGVEKIRDTDDKSLLADHVIDIRTRDELEDLASTVNQMTQGLVHAAEANKDLLLGKTTQKTFIPLDTDKKGRKMTTGYLDLPSAEVFGYYEGAKGVSGDYYDFRQLDNKDGDNPGSPWYGFIKCDVSGKGIVGALIMFTVASVVVNFFRNWTAARDGKNIQLTGLVANINDLLESLRFQGRFAALNTGIVNVQTGRVRLCHAGDNVVHVWRGRQGNFETMTLPQAPATGQIADFMARNLYKHFDLVLEPGDTLLFYTDGIEESQSKFRGSDYQAVAYFDPDDPSTLAEPGARDGDKQAIDNEPLHEPATPADPRRGTPASEGNERINHIVAAFYSRGVYRLEKKYPASSSDTFTFDFSTCEGTAREVITALVSIDRVFRLVPDPKATEEDRVKLDVIQDEFLRKHLREYSRYFRDPRPDPEFEEYRWFSHLKEDEQFDDLTLLAIRKK